MRLTSLALSDYRSYPFVDLHLNGGVTVFTGKNGQGKTNLVEAIGYLATLSSHRVPYDAALVRRGQKRALIRAGIHRAGRDGSVEIEISPGKANRAKTNGSPVPRPREILGLVRTVLFAPEDLSLVKGDPDGRRRFLDELLVAIAPRYAAVRSDYERVVKQRSALLKSAGALKRGAKSARIREAPPQEEDAGHDPEETALTTLEVWDEQLADLGAQLVRARIHLVNRLRPLVRQAYLKVSAHDVYEEALELDAGNAGDVPSPAQIVYLSSAYHDQLAETGPDEVAEPREGELDDSLPKYSTLKQALFDAIAKVRTKEIERGVCLVGPHRDDLLLELERFPAKGYASHGEAWSFALALRLASFELLKIEEGPYGDGEPILILDDVFAELDIGRRARLGRIIAGAEQVLVTAAVEEDIPDQLRGVMVDVRRGEAVVRD